MVNCQYIFVGCRTSNYSACIPELEFSKTLVGGNVVCNITTSFAEGTSLQTVANLNFEFNNPTFYATSIIYKVSTLNNEDTKISGNSYISGILMPPGTIYKIICPFSLTQLP
jgi:hypothetical protein